MNNKKSTIPALLTLGLVVVGSLVTIGIAFLTNNNKIASNPRAAEDNVACQADNEVSDCDPTNNDGVPCPNRDCCFCKNGGLMVFASAQSRVANQMGSACSANDTATSYGPNASAAFYCGGSESGNDGSVNIPGPGTTTSACPVKTTCFDQGFSSTKDKISMDKDNNWHLGDKCAGDKFNRQDIINKCSELNTGDCASQSCASKYGGTTGYDADYGRGKEIFSKSGEPNKFYDSISCDITVDPKTICFQALPSDTPTPTPTPTPTSDPVASSLGNVGYVSDISVTAGGKTYYNCGAKYTITQPTDLDNFSKSCMNRFPDIKPYVVQTKEGVYCCHDVK